MLSLATGLWAIADRRIDAQESNGNAAWRISASNPPTVVSDDSDSEPVAFAVSELRCYLGRILGTQLPEAPSGAQGPVIRLSERRDTGLGEEGYEFRAEGATYHLVGSSPLAVVFGAYEFLRRFGGCRFSDLGPDGEYVPRKAQIEADRGPVRVTPKLWYRGLQFSFYEEPELCRQRIDWMAKNGLNYLMYKPEPDDADPESVVTVDSRSGEVRLPRQCNVYWPFSKGWFDKVLRPEVRKRGLKLDMNHHNLLYWLPPRRYLGKHPEWYAEVNGKRGAMWKQLCICTSNSDAVRTLIENVRTYLRANPEVKVVGIIPEDHMGMCRCRQCVAGDPDPNDATRESSWEAGNRSKSFRYAKLLNAVAAAIRQEFPDVTVGGEAYHDLLWPPRDVAIDPHSTIWLAVHMRDGCRPLAGEETSETNRKIFEILAEWKKVYQGRLILYEYYMGMNAQRSLPYPMSEVICEDWTHLKRLGVQGATVQCWTTNHSVYALNNLAFARCGWSDSVHHDEVLDEYLQGTYGSAAEPLRPIFAGLIQATRGLAREQRGLRPNAGNIGYFLEEVGRATIDRSLKAAEGRAASDRERRQVAKLAAAVAYWELAADALEQLDAAKRIGKSDPRVALASLDQLLNRLWPKLDAATKWSQAPGWVSITAASQWEASRKVAESERAELLARPKR